MKTTPPPVALRMFKRFFGLREPPYLAAVIDVLKQNRIFHAVPRRHLRIIARALYPRKFAPNEVIYYEGDPGLGMYVIHSGIVQLCTGEGEEQIEIGCVRAPEVFGFHSLFGDYRRLETARALTEVRLLGLFRPDLRDLIKYYPRATAPVLYGMGQLLAGLNIEMIQQVSTVRGKAQALRWAYSHLCSDEERVAGNLADT